MNDAYYTQDAERPDLAALPDNPPEGRIGTKIFPIVPVAEKTGVVYYSAITADSAAQTGRSVGVAPTANRIGSSDTTFTCAEITKRGNISPDEVKTLGGIAKADEIGAKWAKRQVANAQETLHAAAVFAVAATQTFDPNKVRSQAQTAINAIRLYEGRKVLIGATATLKIMCEQLLGTNKVGDAFARLISGGSAAQAVDGFSFEVWKQALAVYMGVDEVLAGNDDIWNASTAAQKVAIAKIDAGTDQMSHKWMPVLGKTFQFMPDGAQPYVVRSIPDKINIDNLYDAFIWQNIVTLNSGAIKVIDGIA